LKRATAIICISLFFGLIATPAPAGQFYGFQDAGGGNFSLATIDPTTGVLTVIGPNVAPRASSLDFSPDGTLFGITGGALWSYDITTGAGVRVVDFQPFDCTGFDCDGDVLTFALAISSNGRFFAASGGSTGPSGDTLVEINPNTGAVTAIGNIVNAPSQTGMDFAPNGTLYLESHTDDALYTVDISTGLATLVGPLGLSISTNDLTFDDSTGTLFASANVSDINPATGAAFGNSLLTINLTTGAATFVTSIDFQTNALAWGPPTPPSSVADWRDR